MQNAAEVEILIEHPYDTEENQENESLDTLALIKQLVVIKRDGTRAPYEESKIRTAITKAHIAVQGPDLTASELVRKQISVIAKSVTQYYLNMLSNPDTQAHNIPLLQITDEKKKLLIPIEQLQNHVELHLMRSDNYEVARRYVLYRDERRREREKAQPQQIKKEEASILITLDDGAQAPLNVAHLHELANNACEGLTNTSPDNIVKNTLRDLFNGVPKKEVGKALVMTARTMIEKEPNYTYVTARLLLNNLRLEAFSFLKLDGEPSFSDMATQYKSYFKTYITRGIELEMLHPRLKDFNLDKITAAMRHDRDNLFTYLSLQTLYDRYFLHSNENRYELPQAFFMRVAMGLALNEENKEDRAIEFYNLMSTFDYMSSTPTLFNAGTLRPQLSSCFLTTIPDDLEGIYSAIRDNALLSKFAGGLGNDWTPVRAMNARIKGTNGKSQGVVPFMNVADATAVAVNQGGKRKGAVCGYLETWHLDVEEFLELRKNTGDDRRRTHDMNTANWIPDLFMKRVSENLDWTLFSPEEVPDLHDLYGAAFERAYTQYEEKAKRNEIRNYKTIKAVTLWRKMLGMIFETGHPWVVFKDPCNLRSPQQHAGVVHSSNLCTEITLNTSATEVAVCNLGSINMVQHVNGRSLDVEKLERSVTTAIRMLDNVIDINYYTIPQAKNSNMKHRPIGLGIMGFQDVLYKMGISYSSNEAVEFADRSMEMVSYFAIQASSDLAKQRGSYESFKGSLWSQGILPIDSIDLLKRTRGDYLDLDESKTLDWDKLRECVKTQGMRNSNTMAIAPTATISNITGVSQSIEPTYQNLFVKSNMSGEFTVINPYLVDDLKKINLWDEVMVNDLKYHNGSVQQIDRVPAVLKERYRTAFEIDPKWLVDAAARRQKWIDQAQSLNLYMAQPSGKKLDELYRRAWIRGLKSTYYLRSLGATSAEKSTVDTGTLNAVSNESTQEPKACSIDNPDCEACQ